MTKSKDVPLKAQEAHSVENISTPNGIRHFIITQLAEIRLVEASTIEQEIARNGGDLEIKSDEGTSITGGLEGTLGRELTGPEEISPRYYTSVERLTSILYQSMQKPPKRRAQRKKKPGFKEE
jgi:hypothetical protein